MTDSQPYDSTYGHGRTQGPVADPGVEDRMESLADALGPDLDAEDDLEVNWEGTDELSATFDVIKSTLLKSETPERKSQDVFDHPSTGSDGS